MTRRRTASTSRPARPVDSAPAQSPPADRPRVKLHPHGLDLGGGRILPLWAGAMHYWRHPPHEWRSGLEAMLAMGLRIVDTYVPWGEHEIGPGEYDFGERNPRLDVVRFLELAHSLGLCALVRPGPHVHAEATFFGLPERVVWDADCQARTPGGHPVMVPTLPIAFPLPSHASDAFFRETERWYRAMGERLSPLRWPDGPIVLVQVDNEGALYARPGAHDQDWHPDALQAFRTFLLGKYREPGALRDAWGHENVTFATAEPPRRFDAKHTRELGRYLDWAECREQIASSALDRMAGALARAGLGGLPTTHNLPLSEAGSSLDPARVGSIDLVGLDYGHRVTPPAHWAVLRRTTEMASRCEGHGRPAFGGEVRVGCSPLAPPVDDRDSMYTLMCAMAYGLRGFDLCMAVERDRWAGAPIDPHGRPRPMAHAVARLLSAAERLALHTLVRRAPVWLVVPRALRRMARVMRAFGPLPPAFLNHGVGPAAREDVIEREFELAVPPLMAAEGYLRAFERALDARGVPFAYVGADVGAEPLACSKGARRWIVCATAAGLDPRMVDGLSEAKRAGAVVTMGPTGPNLDAALRPMRRPADETGFEIEPLEDLARAGALVARRIDELGLPTWPVDPADAHVAVHEDERGPRVVFVMNPTSEDLIVRLALAGVEVLSDALHELRDLHDLHLPLQLNERGAGAGDGRVVRAGGGFELRVPSRAVRLMVVDR